MELWDSYDCNRQPLNHTLVRGEPIPNGEYHIVVNVFIVNNKGEILLTQRHPDKHFPLYWECTGGSATVGEDSLIGAVREVEEEIGLSLSSDKFKLVDTQRRKNDFLDSYLVITDVDIHKLKLQPEEVVDAKFVTFDEYISMWNQGLLVPNLNYFINIYKGRD